MVPIHLSPVIFPCFQLRMDERLQKILSQWGIASRRQAEQLILQGRVRLNGAIAELGQKANPERDHIEVDGQPVHPQDRPELVYILLNKPLGVLSTCSDPDKRKTVLDLLPQELQHRQGIHPAGRLDIDSTGALLLTNDGDITFWLTHPSHEVTKTYSAWVEGVPSTATLARWQRGIMLDERMTLPAQVTLREAEGDTRSRLEIVLREGRNRQVRRVAEKLGHPVLRLHRVAIGNIRLQGLPVGQYRFLSAPEIRYLKENATSFSQSLFPQTEVGSDRC